MSKQVLVIAPHPDDETLGAGGTIAKFSSRGDSVFVLVVSGHLPPLYTREQYETTVREAQSAFEILGVTASRFLEIPATMVANESHHALNDRIFRVVAEVEPHIVLCPFPDRHVDHGTIFQSVMVATRPVGVGAQIELIAAFETLSGRGVTFVGAPQMIHKHADGTEEWMAFFKDPGGGMLGIMAQVPSK